jgi:hypothetical protein
MSNTVNPQSENTIAVILSVYINDTPARFLRAFRSVVEQRLPEDYRINMYVGIDGPISQDLRDAIESVRPEITVLQDFPKNRGVAPVVNDIVRELGSEPFIFRMDADDECFPDRFRKQLYFLQANPNVDILGTGLMERSVDGSLRTVLFPATNEEAVQNLYWRVAIANPTVCFRRRVIDATGGYPVENLSEDLAMWFKCAKLGFTFANLQEPLLYFTVDANFWTRRSMKRAWREYLVWTKGIWELDGYSWKLLVPIARLSFRLSPEFIRRKAYASSIRRMTQF